MEKIKCDECPKVIEGYTKKQVRYLLRQHKLKHVSEKEEKRE